MTNISISEGRVIVCSKWNC